jgi:uncharacterized protein
MKPGYDGLRLKIFVHETLRHNHRPLYEDLVLRARVAGLAGATVFRGIEGFGAHRHVHTSRLIDAGDDLPIVVEIVDRPEPIRTFVQSLNGVVDHGMMTVSPVRVVKYGPEVRE